MNDIWFEKLSSVLSGKGVAAYMWDAGADRFEWSGDIFGLLGIGKDACPSNNAGLQQLINPRQAAQRLMALHELMAKAVPGQSPALEVSYDIRRANGTHVHVEEQATLRVSEAGASRVLYGFIRTAARDFSAMENLSSGASPAPGILDSGMSHYGRVSLQRAVESWIEAPPDGRNLFSYLLAVGIDRLSLFNEAFGARFADEVIEKTGARLAQLVGDTSHVTRLDGDVFGVFFHTAPYNEMASVARFILNNFQDAPLQTSRGPLAAGVSIGGVSIDRTIKTDAATLVTRAETAMRSAKKQGRNCFTAYREDSAAASETRDIIQSGNAFMKALKDNRVRLAFQPIMNAKLQNVSFHECLIRYIDETGKVHSAGEFIPAIEKMGLGQVVDQQALRLAIHELTMFPDLQLSVNVSNLSLVNQDWLRGLVAALRDRPSVARRLVVEITESAMMRDVEHTLRVVRTLQDLGCRVALDDFGAGCTAFVQLKALDVDIVKIDKSFIRNLKEAHNHLFVKTLQTLADGIDIETVGEGAETPAEAGILIRDGITHIQGYVYGFPQTERVWLPRDHIHRRGEPEHTRVETIQGERGDDAMMAAARTGRLLAS